MFHIPNDLVQNFHSTKSMAKFRDAFVFPSRSSSSTSSSGSLFCLQVRKSYVCLYTFTWVLSPEAIIKLIDPCVRWWCLEGERVQRKDVYWSTHASDPDPTPEKPYLKLNGKHNNELKSPSTTKENEPCPCAQSVNRRGLPSSWKHAGWRASTECFNLRCPFTVPPQKDRLITPLGPPPFKNKKRLSEKQKAAFPEELLTNCYARFAISSWLHIETACSV